MSETGGEPTLVRRVFVKWRSSLNVIRPFSYVRRRQRFDLIQIRLAVDQEVQAHSFEISAVRGVVVGVHK
jgi:hypothetical protein